LNWKKITYIEYSKSKPIIYLKSIKGNENIPWFFNIIVQATCFSENFIRKIVNEEKPKCLQTNRSFIGAGRQPLEPVGVYQMPFTWTKKKRKISDSDSQSDCNETKTQVLSWA
jgi:hypothetical protein